MKAKKLPSGSYRVRISVGKDPKTGKYVYKSFTADTAKEAERMAYEWIYLKKQEDILGITLKDAMFRYNNAKEKVLSPSTMKEYTRYAENKLQDKWEVPISKVDSEMIQHWISEWSRTLSPKSVRNIYGYINIVLKFFNCGQNIKVTLPQKIPVEYHVVTDNEVKELLKRTENTELNIAISLAAFIPARRSEICALTNADIDRKKNTIRINKAMVKDKNGFWIIKPVPKTFGSNRVVEIPKSIIEKIPNKPGRIIEANPNQIENRFLRAVAHLKEPFRFHDLRHYGATFLHAAGVPDHYIMQRGGWDSIDTLQKIYTHCLPEKSNEAAGIVANKFNSLTE